MKTQKLLLTLLLFVVISWPSYSFARSGCCSHHDGVCGCSCCDGSPLSATCAPYYPGCGSSDLDIPQSSAQTDFQTTRPDPEPEDLLPPDPDPVDPEVSGSVYVPPVASAPAAPITQAVKTQNSDSKDEYPAFITLLFLFSGTVNVLLFITTLYYRSKAKNQISK